MGRHHGTHSYQARFSYNVVAKVMKLPGEVEDYKVSGSLLKYAGVRLKQGYMGTGFNEETRLDQDFSSRLYVMEEIEEKL
jgi:alpha-galactosidase